MFASLFRRGFVALILVSLSTILFADSGAAFAADDERTPDVQGPMLTTDQSGVEHTGGEASDDSTTATTESPTAAADETDKADRKDTGPQLSDSDEGANDSDEKTNASEAAEGIGDKAEREAAEKTDAIDTVGEPLAPGMMKLLQDEVVAGIKRRGIVDRFVRFQRYAIGKVNSSAGRYTGSELAGNCRLKWYDHLMRNVLSAPAEAEAFTRRLHIDARDEHDGVARLVATAAEKLDLGELEPCGPIEVESAEEAINAVRQALTEVQVAYCAALAPLGKSEIRDLLNNAVRSLSTNNRLGHTLIERGAGRRMCDLMEKMDRRAMFNAAEALAPLTDTRLLERLKSMRIDPQPGGVAGVTGAAARIETPAGAIVLGDEGSNTYDLDKMTDVAAVIDRGGDDVYLEGTVGPQRPVLVLIDLAGDDAYRGAGPGVQGGAVLGVSMLLDLAGNDTYQAQEIAQGSALAGIGMLVDYAGDDRYVGLRRMQGQALGGLGLLIDRGGNDDYRAALWGQGMGAPARVRAARRFGRRRPLLLRRHVAGLIRRDARPRRLGTGRWRGTATGGKRRRRRNARRRRRRRL